MSNLHGKVAVVTGAASGIGHSIATRLASAGASVVICDLNGEAAKEAAAALPASGSAKHGFAAVDVTRKEQVQAAVQDIIADYGAIDILCNNAGVSTMNRIEDLTEKEWDFNFDVNAKGVFLFTQAVFPYMKARGSGKMINTASMAGKRATPLLAHYAASKWAVVGFTKSAAVEFAPFGVTVNCVCPGFVRTSMQERELEWEAELRGMTPEEVKDEYVKLTPMGRIQEPEDVAKAVCFLASEEADFITGEALDVTGGAHLL
ncbi:SDR family NAD(P)-dependent oxidoreductase [Cohnella thailandensis]|uniref:SDR family oxidoreductase n=1 Tax=Cohnella thailandensis TaxID=557557 RepID=A0A841T2J8_9BACL|nr:SDR family NAD(P)-dependent oxidoreductase [Cohnella thailandensis]MBB6636290.1 SDR family oxidoreductase [Cohnella thailandensis]MBP1973741.1 NAD(P)-dependent dehydrogenase (short-subunit alcohol dehydrogenase family) [Cohnella thailandensis]